ncbi:TIR domain-containing protein [Streptomyces sp. MBT53]|uniref:TIR domain-containing protein n=1 Tax=Streptomyces sp. MBT53 TaxID=1488384 RepID=UPI00191371D3|nr:TIR domain-containing protein [Streptomyces sp. MBT53]MBK6018059.1 toll/interleukin-1 receptor domain-containing protein [Streptomyces sp. MBT53]
MSAPPPPGPVPAGPPGLIPHWFFTGYSDSKANFSRVKRFHEDVEKEVRLSLGEAVPGRGFVDFRDIRPGERWEDRIVENGICTTRAMLALYSPSYFQSHWCAHEWTVFTARLSQYRSSTGAEVPCLIGVRWQRTRQAWPEEVTTYQYVRRDPNSLYEKRGLIHLVPHGEQDGGTQEYWEIVHEVADVIVDAHDNPLPSARLDDAWSRSAFGPESSLYVDVVLTYSDRNRDWGDWVHALLAERREVSVLPSDCLGRVPAELLRNSLTRAHRVVALISRHSLAEQGPNKAVLEEMYDDPDVVDNLPRFVPLFIEDVPEEIVPAKLLPRGGKALYDIPDSDAVRDIVLAAVNAPVASPAVAQIPEPKFPSDAVSAFESELADKLSLASSLRDKDLRDVWFQATGLDASRRPPPGLRTRPWVLSVILASRKWEDGYERLAVALECLDQGAPETIEVRRLVAGRRSGATAAARPSAGTGSGG